MSAHGSAPVPVGEAGTGAPDVFGFVVLGRPRPKGSMRHVGHGRMVEQVDNADWRVDVKAAAAAAITDHGLARPVFSGPVGVHIALAVPRPKSAPKTRRIWPVTRSSGDVDKHARLILDALTDVGVWADDAQVVHLVVYKDYADPATATGAGAIIHIEPWGGG